jgi:hypothetical protein
LPGRAWILSYQGIRHGRSGEVGRQIHLEDSHYLRDLALKGWDASMGEHRCPVSPPFTASDNDHPVAEIDVFDPERSAFSEPEPGPIEQAGHQMIQPGEMRKDIPYFAGGKDNGEALRLPGPRNLIDFADLLAEHLVVEEGNSVQGLILGGSGDLKFLGQMGKKGMHFRCTHLERMLLVVKKDESFDPLSVCFCGSGTQVA